MKLALDNLPSVTDDAVSSLDPLKADAIYARLPEMNRQADVNAIVQAVRSITPTLAMVEQMNMVEMCAATRDIGMLLASIKRHGTEPVEAVPEVQAPLLAIAEHTGLVPREMLFHTSVWNPRTTRQRMFTGDKSEDVLFEATRTGVRAVERSIERLLALMDIPFAAPEFSSGCMTVANEVSAMVEAVNYTRTNISPQFFARELRPFFEQIRIGDGRYSGAAAAVLAIGVVDHVLWSCDCNDDDYRQFQETNVTYTRPRWRELYAKCLGLPSLVTRLRQAMARVGFHGDPWLNKACAGVSQILRVLLHFRGRHRLLAQAAYDASVRLYVVGSAGYGVDTLEHLITLTYESTRAVRHAHAMGRRLSTRPFMPSVKDMDDMPPSIHPARWQRPSFPTDD